MTRIITLQGDTVEAPPSSSAPAADETISSEHPLQAHDHWETSGDLSDLDTSEGTASLETRGSADQSSHDTVSKTLSDKGSSQSGKKPNTIAGKYIEWLKQGQSFFAEHGPDSVSNALASSYASQADANQVSAMQDSLVAKIKGVKTEISFTQILLNLNRGLIPMIGQGQLDQTTLQTLQTISDFVDKSPNMGKADAWEHVTMIKGKHLWGITY